MTVRTYDDICELCEDIVDTYLSSAEDTNVCVIAKYEEAKRIISELCSMDFTLTSCVLHDQDFDGYDDEYIIDIFSDEVWCEPAKRDGEYIYSESLVTYLLDNCNSKILSKIETIHTYEVHLYDEDMEYDCDVDENSHGFTASKSDEDGYRSFSFYSTEHIDHEDMMDLLRIFGL